MQNRSKIANIRALYLQGRITLAEAKAMVAPILEEINAAGERISKEHKRRFHKLTFGYVFR